MKPLAAILILALLVGCAESSREEVLSRFDSGEKQVVGVYRGSGSNEALTERRTYDQNGTLILLENLEAGSRQTFVDLNPQLQTADGLADFLAGEWHEYRYSELFDGEEYFGLSFSGPNVEVTYGFYDLSDGERSQDTSVFSAEYFDGLRVSMEAAEEEKIADNVDVEESLNPEPMFTDTIVEIIDSRAIMLRDYEVYQGDIRIPTASINKLLRDKQKSESEQYAWGAEYDEITDEIREESDRLIEDHFPGWAARRHARSDRSIGDILDSRRYRRERAVELQEFLSRTGLTPEEYRAEASLTAEEFGVLYLFNDDGTIPPDGPAWELIEVTDSITGEESRRAMLRADQTTAWVYRISGQYYLGFRSSPSVSYGAEQLTLRIDESPAFQREVFESDNGSAYVTLTDSQVERLRRGGELLIRYESISGERTAQLTLLEASSAIGQIP